MDEISPQTNFINTEYFKGQVRSEAVSLEINYHAWALCEYFNACNAAALWCDLDPYLFNEWGEREYVEVLNNALNLIAHEVKMDIARNPEKYSVDQLSSALKVITGRFNEGTSEFLKESGKYMFSRNQLKAIAEKIGARPKFLYFSDPPTQDIGSNSKPIQISDDTKANNEQVLTPSNKYELRDIDFKAWIAETKPDLNNMIIDDIQKALIAHNSKLFASGFDDWWKRQQIHKGTAGRKKKVIK